jgi:hypothetical protein
MLPMRGHSVLIYDSIAAPDRIIGSTFVDWPGEEGIVYIPLPPLGVEKFYEASVGAVDTLGLVGQTALSGPQPITIPADLPPTPDSVVVDTIPDTLIIGFEFEADSIILEVPTNGERLLCALIRDPNGQPIRLEWLTMPATDQCGSMWVDFLADSSMQSWWKWAT